MTLTTGTTLGPYEILSEVGAGGIGEVYRARDSRLQRDVAVKVLSDRFAQDDDALARFRRENTALAALSHPNIRGIYNIGTHNSRTYAVMELLEGITLATRLEHSALDWREAVRIGLGVAEGLSAAHEKGIIHRDIKPKNIFLTADGGVKILDFGLARLETHQPKTQEGSTSTTSLATQPGTILGTASYMSPEQVRSRQMDARSDIFSFGCVLYEMLAGRRAFCRETVVETMTSILNEDPSGLAFLGAGVPAELERIVQHCLEKKPANRFQSARDLIFALSGVASGQYADGDASTLRLNLTPARRRRTGVQAAAPAGPSVAVLPFANMSSDPENEYFSDGLADELMNALCRIEGLHVASRTSAFAFKGKNLDIRELGERLNVRTVLEGSVRRAGERLRITAQLVGVDDGYHLWSETFDRQLEDVFAIQSEISQAIAEALQVVLSEKEKRAISKVPTTNMRAYEYYLRGRQLLHQFRRTAVEQAQKLFVRASELDPEYAAAYAGVADCCAVLHTYWGASDAHRKEADVASRKALELAPDQAEVHVSRAMALSLGKQLDQAQEEFETAIRLDPDLFDAYYFYARTCYEHGKLEQAARLFDRASSVNPEDYQAPCLAATVYAGLGRTAEHEDATQRALAALESHLELYPQDGRALYMRAIIHVHMGEHQLGLEWARRALSADPNESLVLYNVACTYALVGRADEAIDCIECAIDLGGSWREWIENDPDLNCLRSHPRFQALVMRL